MKTEREFINSVYAKYEAKKTAKVRRIKLYRNISFCAAAACICLVSVVGFRIIPYLDAANDTAKYNYTLMYDAEEAEMPLEEDSDTSGAGMTGNAQEIKLYSAKSINEDGVAFQDEIDSKPMVNSALMDMSDDEVSLKSIIKFEQAELKIDFLKNVEIIIHESSAEVIAESENICEVFCGVVPKYNVSSENVSDINAELKYGICEFDGEEKHYISLKNDEVLLILNRYAYTEADISVIADSIEY